MNRFIHFMLMLGIVTILSCGDDNGISEVPEISFVSISPETATANVDEWVLTISYTDGDGDLGENTSGVKNVFVTDSRNNVTYQFRLQQLAPTGSTIAIQGKVDIYLNKAFLVDEDASSEKITFSAYVVDRAGNESNTIQSSEVTVVP